jgi:predicted nucleotidyltransferase
MGRLDLLGTIGPGLDYDNLLPHSELMEVELGLTVRVLTLETLIALKEQAGRDKDLAVLPLLRAVLNTRKKAEGHAVADGRDDSRSDG